MSVSNKKFDYRVARSLHWVAAYLIFFNLLSGWRLGDFSPSMKEALAMFHSGMGTLIGVLMVFRWWWRRSRKLYPSPGWWRRPYIFMQLSFYPLLLVQVILGIVHAAFIDYDVRAFGLINYSALAPDNEGWHGLFLRAHGLTGLLLLVLIVIHSVKATETS